MKFRKKPVVIEAKQLTDESFWDVYDWIESFSSVDEWCWDDKNHPLMERYIAIKTLEGTMRATENDWVIRGVKGEFYPCKADIFDATYEAVGE